MTGTHSGSLMGTKPVRKKMEEMGVNIDRVVDGKLEEHERATNIFERYRSISAVRIIGEEESA